MKVMFDIYSKWELEVRDKYKVRLVKIYDEVSNLAGGMADEENERVIGALVKAFEGPCVRRLEADGSLRVITLMLFTDNGLFDQFLRDNPEQIQFVERDYIGEEGDHVG